MNTEIDLIFQRIASSVLGWDLDAFSTRSEYLRELIEVARKTGFD